MRTVQHWIDGKPWDGAPARTGDVFDPSTGEVQAQVALAGPAEIDAAVQSASQAFARVARGPALAPGADPVRVPRGAGAAQGRARRGDQRRARQGAVRRARRGRARPGGRRVRVRDPAPAQGRLLGVGVDRHGRALDPPAARRRRRDHAVQLPGDGAHVDVPGRDRVRERVRAEAERPRSVGVAAHRRAVGRGRAARRACSPCCRATRKRSTGC